jgi:hypothetical protein
MSTEPPLNLSLGATLPAESTLVLLPAESSLKGSSKLLNANGDVAEGIGDATVEVSLCGSSTLLQGSLNCPVADATHGKSDGEAVVLSSLSAPVPDERLLRDTLKDRSDGQHICSDGLLENGVRCSSQVATAQGDQLVRPIPVTEDFYEEDSMEGTVGRYTKPLPCAASLTSSIGDFSNASALGLSHDSLGYSFSNAASSSCACSTMQNTMQGFSGPNSFTASQGMETAEALRAALYNVEVRTPTPPGSPRLAMEEDKARYPPCSHDNPAAAPHVMLQHGQLEVFSSAVRGAEGLDKDLQQDLLAILKSLPEQLPSR